jgi:hypothetical protein
LGHGLASGWQPLWAKGAPEDPAGLAAELLKQAAYPDAAVKDDDEPERYPDCHMPLTMHHDPRCSQPCGRCEARKAADPEVAAMAAVIAAMDRLDDDALLLGEDVHERVIRWAMARWNVRA